MSLPEPAIAYGCLYSTLHSGVEMVGEHAVECGLARLEIGIRLAVVGWTGEDKGWEDGLALALVDDISLLEIGFLLPATL